jgi:SAM-dependent methyltransferase
MTRSPFDALASEYDAARPSYPDGLYDALDALAGPLDGALVAEVGAGTGISTRGLLSRGADVVAYDLAPNMLERLRANGSPGPGALLGGRRGRAGSTAPSPSGGTTAPPRTSRGGVASRSCSKQRSRRTTATTACAT